MNHRTSYIAIFLAVSLIIAALAAQLISVPEGFPQFDRIQNSLHAPGAGILAVALMLLLKNPQHPIRGYILAAITAGSIGTIGEVLQMFGPRDADPMDLAHNFLGIIGFLGTAALLDPSSHTALSQGLRRTIMVISGMALFASIAPLLWNTYILTVHARSLPVVMSFEHRWEQEFVEINRARIQIIEKPTADWPSDGLYIARMQTRKSRYSGISIQPYDDWTGYQFFTFLAESENGVDQQMTLSISDTKSNRQYYDRFNTSITVTATPQRFRFALKDIENAPKERRLDLGSVAKVNLFISDPNGDEQILLDDFRLEE